MVPPAVHWTTEPDRKFAPVMVIGNAPTPDADLVGVMVEMVGPTIVKLAELEVLVPT